MPSASYQRSQLSSQSDTVNNVVDPRSSTISNNSKHGYTPGDSRKLYVGPDKRIQEMHYHRGGPKKPTEVIVTWAGYKKAGPLLFSTDQRGRADGKPLRGSFSDVSVKVTGSDNWTHAQ
jgi:hypothetical protein